MDDLANILFVAVPISALIGLLIGNTRNRPGAGVAFSLLLGPIGWLIVLLGPDCRRKCQFCAEVIKPEARICPHCQQDLFKTSPSAQPYIPNGMAWYYADESQNVFGPVSLEELNAMVAEGTISIDTQICRVGSKNWAPVSGVVK
jgi:hypothetical protein